VAEIASSPLPPPSDAGQSPIDVAARTEMQAKSPRPGDPWIGRVLDERYRITERLGEGGMGAVFVAEHLKLRKQVALKMIRAELAGNGEVAVRFAREAMATAQFEHPHVASAIDYGTVAEGGAYLVMQLVRGQSLRDLLETQKRLPWPVACELLAQVADALSAARGAGIVHRDLKPENILVETREDGSRLAKILDFGIAHVIPQATALEPHSRELTRVGTVMGTPGYMSPEQAVGDKIDHRTDLYALGVVLWECIAGRPLWDGPDITSIIGQQLRDDVPRLRELPGLRVPRALDELVQRLCARTPDGRPDHAGAVRDQLRALAHAPRLAERPLGFVYDGWLRARGYFIALPGQTRALLGLGAVAAVLAILAISSGSTTPPAAKPADPAEHGANELKPADTGDQPTLVQRAMDAARKAVTPGSAEPSKSAIPAELTEPVKTMQESQRTSERRKAALKVLAYKGKLPPHIRAIATLEEARTCRERKEAIAAMVTLKDTRCLDALRRYSDSSKTGCGFLSLEDCYGCIRGDLRKAVSSLEGKPEE
jgi:tRNA A-37 threonylcarbamoyl transferase component Bud32